MSLSAILKAMCKSGTPLFPSETALENIRKIKAICNADYSNQRFYGSASLNRKMLLDKRIAELLTPETIAAILSLHRSTYQYGKNSESAIWRNSTGYVSLAAVLYYGFSEGTEAIRLMPNNEPHYNKRCYDQQKAQYSQHTLTIIENIKKAAALMNIDIEDAAFQEPAPEEKTLPELFHNIASVIKKIKAAGKNNQLLYVPGYSPDQIRNQSVTGFNHLCKRLNVKFKNHFDGSITLVKPTTLASFSKSFITSNEAMLDGTVTHLFYDRAHLEACLEQNQTIFIEDKAYQFRDIFEEIVKQCDKSDHNVAKEQMQIRLTLVDSHLRKTFPVYYRNEIKDNESPIDTPIGYREIKKCITLLERKIDNEFWTGKDMSAEQCEKDFYEKIIASYDEANGSLPLSKCVLLAKWQNPRGYAAVLAKKGDNFVFNFLSDKACDDLMQGPRLKNQATIELEKVVHALLGEYRKLYCSYNALNELEITIDNTLFNITDILRNQPDFEQITLTKEQLDQYVKFVGNKTWRGVPYADRDRSQDAASECDQLHYGEKIAINHYTGQAYTQLQNFLRHDGQKKGMPYSYFSNLNQLAPDILLNVCVAAHGLSKPIGTRSKRATNQTDIRNYRKEALSTTCPHFQDRVNAKNTRKPLVTKGFASTSSTNSYRMNANIFTLYHESSSPNPFGKSISQLSYYPVENEVLYAPGVELQYTDSMQINGQHFFAVRPVRSLNNIKTDDYSPSARARHELEIIDKMLENFLRDNKHSFLRRLFDTVSHTGKRTCIERAKSSVHALLESKKSPQDLDQASLLMCQSDLEQAITANTLLVERATLGSLGSTNTILQAALTRINRAINLTGDQTIQVRNES